MRQHVKISSRPYPGTPPRGPWAVNPAPVLFFVGQHVLNKHVPAGRGIIEDRLHKQLGRTRRIVRVLKRATGQNELASFSSPHGLNKVCIYDPYSTRQILKSQSGLKSQDIIRPVVVRLASPKQMYRVDVDSAYTDATSSCRKDELAVFATQDDKSPIGAQFALELTENPVVPAGRFPPLTRSHRAQR